VEQNLWSAGNVGGLEAPVRFCVALPPALADASSWRTNQGQREEAPAPTAKTALPSRPRRAPPAERKAHDPG
jgi:hypothetical protein